MLRTTIPPETSVSRSTLDLNSWSLGYLHTRPPPRSTRDDAAEKISNTIRLHIHLFFSFRRDLFLDTYLDVCVGGEGEKGLHASSSYCVHIEAHSGVFSHRIREYLTDGDGGGAGQGRAGETPKSGDERYTARVSHGSYADDAYPKRGEEGGRRSR
ncbi:hypothetical protein COCSADRAFT_210776 [Bipolaris sorokiniana ND90Pr]|uniref:Uncharacterized protein n=1 Tax=Cochliobolus sativus (strain ND90Pr / ATCC 201652) TaxID=665912 RepID=M2RSF0_COCSN|nr:uncharacterized protein COCSADRAFT_210776 [Bipolaris sorokiniana ND90Pr]EMD69509.1 hypothetical protein COCSADRAFT_210776 [Bipolaris sorokiniana ND90Pr]